MKKQSLCEWSWAYQNQLVLLDSHDAYWIKCASSQWEGREGFVEFGNFLTSYGLRRGKIAKYFSKDKNVKFFIKKCNEIFMPKIKGNIWTEAQQRWNEINNIFEPKIGAIPASASLKTFWFYHSDILPMYDQYAKKALQSLVEENVNPTNYLILFKDFYINTALENINTVHELSPRKYISKPRVADKYLWLLGNKKRNEVIRNFNLGQKLSK